MNATVIETRDNTADVPETDRVKATDKAVRHILKQMETDPSAIGFRLEVKRTGCSGWMYVVDLAREPRDEDLIFNVADGLDIFVDKKSFEFVHGTEIDFISEGLTRHLVFNNPNVTAECGCGESFSID
ncbi:Iron binding protein SufA for iron-sulfur cluster assembly [Thioalkalivibrio nitratireducens DSM 14787]|uniref:Iron binding protein SufA for iron-sulfur cluster assembly n=1 Tax=Thioalkalivibrio nitratireducens (strain DSM 14787 / UNIQEM 213 / ALEN2) TaxID=1255043 RepID=L0DWS8_THIND|nr:iron-sulfur cluster assembly accessory protein [Thioalkalivibrio nitratireducens]AGA33498.1 Iron binding protein SufA for iron-sulfur cluster assembly [Thioalkalivibrio nitratireducens DSM 14787]